LVHTMRHAAAKAVSDLGLSGAGLVRVRGWYAAPTDWQDAYSPKPEDLMLVPDEDPREQNLGTRGAGAGGGDC